MKSNSHYIWDDYKSTPAYYTALSYMDQIKEYAKAHNCDVKAIKLIGKKELLERGHHHAMCQILWTEGPQDWAYMIMNDSHLTNVWVEAHNGTSLTFYNI